MRKIKLDTTAGQRIKKDSPYSKHHKYRIGFDTGILYFSSKRELHAFSNACSKFLNIKMMAINRLYADILVQYRSIYFYLDPHTCKQASQLINEIQINFDRLTCYDRDRTHSYYSQHRLQKILNRLLELTSIIQKIKFSRNDHQQVYEVKYTTERLTDICLDLVDYPQNVYDECTGS